MPIELIVLTVVVIYMAAAWYWEYQMYKAWQTSVLEHDKMFQLWGKLRQDIISLEKEVAALRAQRATRPVLKKPVPKVKK